MPGSQGSSFIPKQPARGRVQRRGVRKIYVFTYISFVLFFGTLIAAGGTFFYKVSVDSQLQSEKEKLVEQRNAFSQADIERVKELDMQLTAAQDLLDNHISVVTLFEALEAATVSNIELSGFSFLRSDSEGIEINLAATAKDFNSVLFQRSIVDANPVLAGAKFEGLSGSAPKQDSQEIGTLSLGSEEIEVTFSIKKDLSPAEIPYRPRSQTFNTNATVATSTESAPVSDDGPVGEESDNQLTQ